VLGRVLEWTFLKVLGFNGFVGKFVQNLEMGENEREFVIKRE
jgi:hypothetical protein